MINEELKTHGRMPLALPGWDDYSVWGWDEAEGSLFAQLWRNADNPRDEPRVWLSPAWGFPPIPTVEILARLIASLAECSQDDARHAMARSAPASVKTALLGVTA